MSGLKQQARVMEHVLASLNSHWMAEEAILTAQHELHKARIERLADKLEAIL